MEDFFSQVEKERKKIEEERKSIQEIPQKEVLEQLKGIQNIRDNKQKAEELRKELYRRAIENIKISEMEIYKINKHNFEDKNEVIDILLYAVGKMAQDPIFYKLNIVKLKDYTPIHKKEAE